MADIEVSRVIAAPAEQLYDMVSDLPRMGEWSPENQGGKWIKGAVGPAVGARFQGTNANESKRWTTTCVIEQADRGKAFAFRVSVGPIKVARWTYAFEPADGGTRVLETWTDRRGWFAKTVGGKASGVADRIGHNRAGMETTLANLAGAVER
jgi:ribosome-associated toxin RatA of RatAB toxin-antitoxin module